MQLHIDIYIWCAFIIFVFIKLSSNVVFQGRARMKTGIVDYPEDQKGPRRLVLPNPANPSDQMLVRASSLFRNDLENIIPFSLVALAAAFVQVDAQIYLILLIIYAAARIIHAACFIGGRQPFRSIGYILGQLCAIALVVMIAVRLIPIFQTY